MHPVQALYHNLAAKAERPALYDGETTLTHVQLVQHVERVACNVRSGARVGLCAGNTWRHVVAYLAILRAGAVWVPLNPRNGARLNTELRARAKLALTLCDQASRDAVGDPTDVTELETWLEAEGAGDVPALPSDPDAVFAIKFTGGSTGQPKGVVQTVRSAARAMVSMQRFYEFNESDVNLAVAPLTHGASHYVIPVLAAGGAHVLLAQPDRTRIAEELKRRVSIAFMPPTLIHLLMSDAAFAPADFPSLRHITYSAAPMAPAAIEKAIARFGPVISTLYGQTEAPMTITALSSAEMKREELRASVGRAFADTPIAVLGVNGEITAHGEGEVLVGGDLADTTYLDDQSQTRASRHEGWLKTGDIGRIDEAGYLYLLGRSKEMIISGGYNIYPAEVERALAAHPAVREACAFGVADEVWGERLEAAVAADGVDEAALRAFVREALGAVRTPKRLHLLAALPRNPVGKVVRNDVRALCAQQEQNLGEEAVS
jgi:acyl-CoA synthetase (AMP-forming)/AMP-acid ligase II